MHCIQVRNDLASETAKAGVTDTPDAVFSFLIERVRNNLHIILCMSPVGDPFRWVCQMGVSNGCVKWLKYPLSEVPVVH